MRTSGGIGVLRAPLLDARLETPRLRLRPLVDSDGPVLADHLSDVSVTRWLARVPHPCRTEDVQAFIGHVRLAAVAGTAVTFGIVAGFMRDDRVIGVVAVHGMDVRPEFGYWLARPFWGRGMMTEASEAVLDWVHARLALPEINSGAFEGNDASLAIQRRLGFRVVGQSMRPCFARGGDVPHVDTVLTPADYAAAAAGRTSGALQRSRN